MAHIRKLIRDNLVTTLTGLTTTGTKVYQTRVYPISAASLPGLAIYTKSESSEYVSIAAPRTVQHLLVALVEVYVQANSGYDNTLDTIASEIETALYSDVTRGGYAKDTRITEFDSEFSGDPDQPVAFASLTVEIDYMTLEGDPESAV